MNNKKKQSNKANPSFFEQLKDTAGSEISNMGKTAASSILGRYPSKGTQGEVRGPLTNPERRPFGQKKEQKKSREIMLFNWAERSESMEVNRQIRELVQLIRQEIGALEKQNKLLVAQAAKLTIEQLPENAGIYHIRFFEWILKTLKDIKKNVGESATWFAAMQGKRKKMGFWGKAKKHGTAFTLSGERTAATQTG